MRGTISVTVRVAEGDLEATYRVLADLEPQEDTGWPTGEAGLRHVRALAFYGGPSATAEQQNEAIAEVHRRLTDAGIAFEHAAHGAQVAGSSEHAWVQLVHGPTGTLLVKVLAADEADVERQAAETAVFAGLPIETITWVTPPEWLLRGSPE